MYHKREAKNVTNSNSAPNYKLVLIKDNVISTHAERNEWGEGAIKTVIFCREIKNGRKNPIKPERPVETFCLNPLSKPPG